MSYMKASVYQCFILFVSVWCSHKPLGWAVRDVGNVPMMAIMTFGAAATALSYSNKVWNTNIYNPTFSYPVQDTMTVHHNWLCLSR